MRRATIFLATGVVAAFGIGITHRLTHALPDPTRVKLGQTFKVTDGCSIKPVLLSNRGNLPTVNIFTDDNALQTSGTHTVGEHAICSKRDGSSVRVLVKEITPNDVLFSFSPSPYN